MAGELHRPVWLGCVYASTKHQSESSVPEDLGTLGPYVVCCCESSDTMRGNTFGAEMNVRFRCCWGCWWAPRSSSHGAAAVASTHRSPTTSCPWQAARSGQDPLQQTTKKKIILSYQNHWTRFCLLQVWSVAPQHVKCAQTQIVLQSVPTSAGECCCWCLVFFRLHTDKTPHIFLFIVHSILR